MINWFFYSNHPGFAEVVANLDEMGFLSLRCLLPFCKKLFEFTNILPNLQTELMKLHPYFDPDLAARPKIPYGRYYRRGMGTDGVAQFLYSMIKMVRPKRALEVGMGYTTPWILRGLDDTTEINVDRTLDPKYFRIPYNPELVCIDEAVPETQAGPFSELLQHPRMRFIQGKFQGKASDISCNFGKCDFVWFDCGGPDEYADFCKEYIPICSDYLFLHFTYLHGVPNRNHEVVMNAINTDDWFHLDIVEPHRFRQGSLTVLRRKVNVPSDS